MEHPIPKAYTAQLKKVLEWPEIQLDVEVTITVFGEVIHTHVPFLDLPAEARRLMLGREQAYVERKLEGLIQLWTFAYPLMAMDICKTGNYGLVRREITLLRTRGWEWEVNPEKHIRHAWTRIAWINYNGSYSGRRRTPHRLLYEDLSTAAHLLYGDQKERREAFIKVTPRNGAFLVPVLMHMAGSAELYGNVWPQTYTALGKAQDPVAHRFLSNLVAAPSLYGNHIHVLAGLAYYRDDELRQQLLDYYHAHPMTVNLLIPLLEGLKHYQDEEVKAVLFKELLEDHHMGHVSREASLESLKHMGVSDQEILAYLLSRFRERDSIPKLSHILHWYQKIPGSENLPTPGDVMDTYEWIIEKEGKHQLEKELGGLLKRVGVYQAIPRIRQLSGDTTKNKLGALALMREVLQPGQIELVLPALSDTDTEVRSEAMNTIEQMAKGRGILRSVDPLLKVVTQDIAPLRYKALLALRYSLSPVNSQRARGPLMSLLKYPDADVRALAISLLGRMQSDPELISHIVELVDDEDKKVHLAATKARDEYRRQQIKKRRATLDDPDWGEVLVRIIVLAMIALLCLWLRIALKA